RPPPEPTPEADADVPAEDVVPEPPEFGWLVGAPEVPVGTVSFGDRLVPVPLDPPPPHAARAAAAATAPAALASTRIARRLRLTPRAGWRFPAAPSAGRSTGNR